MKKKTPPKNLEPAFSQQTLTDKQEAFCVAYVSHFNAAKAAVSAGYAVKHVDSQAAQLLSNPKVKARVSQLMQQFADDHEVLKHRIIKQLTAMAFSDITDFVEVTDEVGTRFKNWEELPREVRSCIAEVNETVSHGENGMSRSQRLKLVDKMKAIELLGRHLSLFSDTTINNNTINIGAALKNQPDHVIIELAKESIKKLSEG